MDFWTQATACFPLILTYFIHLKVHFSFPSSHGIFRNSSCFNISSAFHHVLVKVLSITLFITKHKLSAGCGDAEWSFLELNKSYLNGLQWPQTATLLGNSRSTLHTTLKPIPAAELCAACRDNENFPVAALQLMKTLFFPPVRTETGYFNETIKKPPKLL